MRGGQEVSIDKANPLAHQSMSFDEVKEFIKYYSWSHRKGLKMGQEFISVFQISACQFTEYKGMTNYLCIQEQFFKMSAASTEMINPYRGINDNHS
ncbi:MAG: hypothetical protein PVG64_09260 [Syntrophobacterales bacterium]